MKQHKRSIRHREISAFQSVAEIAARKDAEKKGYTSAFNLEHPIIGAVTHFIGSLFDAHPDKDPAREDPAPHVKPSMLSTELHIAWESFLALVTGRPQDVAGILRDLKDSTLDPTWIEAIVEYVEVYGVFHQGTPVYSPPADCPYNSEFPVLPDTGTFRVALIADWATGEPPAKDLLRHLMAENPDCLIHLGDVYYSGTHNEYEHNLLEVFEELIPRNEDGERIPIFNLAGNHDYFSGGAAYLEATMKLNGPGRLQQKGSSFALRNPSGSWCLQGMDTGYNDHDPMASRYKAVSARESMTRLHPDDVAWQQEQLQKTEAAGGKTILLSHHALFSAYQAIGDETRKAPGTQYLNTNLQEVFQPWIDKGSIAGWYWGHEHSLEIYQPYAGLDKGRCIGCGAIPVLGANYPYFGLDARDGEVPPALVQRDGRPVELGTHIPPEIREPFYNLAYVMLEFDGDACVARYMECNASQSQELHQEHLGTPPGEE